MCKFRENIPLRSRPNNPRIFFFEYGHDGYQKNPLLMQISKKSSYHSHKIHLEKVMQKCYEKFTIGPLKKSEPFLFQNIWFWVHFVLKVSRLFWNLYRKRILLIYIMTIFNEKKISWFLGLGLKFEVVSRIGFWPIFIIFWN
jgi:hypothetical protein